MFVVGLLVSITASGCSSRTGMTGIDDIDPRVARTASSVSGGILALERRAERERAQDERPTMRRTVALPPGVTDGTLEPPTDPVHAGRATMPLEKLLERARSIDLPALLAPSEDLTPSTASPLVQQYVHARVDMEDGRYDRAIELLEPILRKNPNAVDVQRTAARCLLELNRDADALQAYQRIVRLDPDDPEALYAVATKMRALDADLVLALLARARQAMDEMPVRDTALRALIDLRIAQIAFSEQYVEAGMTAGAAALEINPADIAGSHVRREAMSAFSQLPILQIRMGDVHCMRGEWSLALDRYDVALAAAQEIPRGLISRMLYASLSEGRDAMAQQILFNAYQSVEGGLNDIDIVLAGYLADHVDDASLIAGAMREAYGDPPHDMIPLRILARFLPPDESRELRLTYVLEHVTEDAVWPSVMRELARDDVESGARCARAIIRRRPDRADLAARHLIAASRRPTSWLDVFDGSSREDVLLASAVDLRLLRLGSAWRRLGDAVAVTPDDIPLRALRIRVAGELAEPQLVSSSIAAMSSAELNEPLVLAASLHALRAVGRSDIALSFVRPDDPFEDDDVWAASAQCALDRATRSFIPETRRAFAQRAVDDARKALRLVGTNRDAAEVLARVHGENGILSDRSAFRDAMMRLRLEHPSGVMAMEMRLTALLREGRWALVVSEAKRAYASDPTSLATLAAMIEGWAGGNALDEGVEWFHEQLDRRGNDPLLLAMYVALHTRMSRTDAIIDDLAARLEAEPRHHALRQQLQAAVMQSGDGERALRLARERLADRPDGPQRTLWLASAQIVARRYDEATATLNGFIDDPRANTATRLRAVEIAKVMPDGTDGRSLLLARLCDVTIDELDVDEMPPGIDTVFGIGMLARALIDVDDDRIVQLAQQYTLLMDEMDRPPMREVRHWQGLMQHLIDEDRRDRAAQILRTRLTAGVRTPIDVYLPLVMMCAAIDATRGDVQATLDILQQLEAEGTLPATEGGQVVTLGDLMVEIASMYSVLGAHAGQQTISEALLSIQPDRAMSMNNLGYSILAHGGGAREAWRWIERAFEAMPDEPNVIDSLAWLRYHQGRIEDDIVGPGAWSLIRDAVARFQRPSAEVLLHYADIAWAAGEREDAIDGWQRVIEELDRPGERERVIENLRRVQLAGWGLLVADPTALYDQQFGRLRRQATACLDAIAAGEVPPVTPMQQDGARSRTPE